MWIIIAYDPSPVHVTCLLSSPLALPHTCCRPSHQVLAASQQGVRTFFIALCADGETEAEGGYKTCLRSSSSNQRPQLLSAARPDQPLPPGAWQKWVLCFQAGALVGHTVSVKGVPWGHLGDCGSEEVLPSQPSLPTLDRVGAGASNPVGFAALLAGVLDAKSAPRTREQRVQRLETEAVPGLWAGL